MKLTEKEKMAREKICMALDLHDESQILKYVKELSAYIGYFKLNFAFTLFGPDLVKKIKSHDVKVFLDLKIHDIPNTISGYVKSVFELGVDLVTVHTEGGTIMLQECVNAAKQYEQKTGKPRPKFIGVTLLTSIDEQTLNNDLNIKGKMEDEVLRRAQMAVSAGLDGIVCSAVELSEVRKQLPDTTFFVTPGVRASNVSANDHKRVVTYRDAITAGSSLLVVGRDLLASDDRIGYAKSIIHQITDSK